MFVHCFAGPNLSSCRQRAGSPAGMAMLGLLFLCIMRAKSLQSLFEADGCLALQALLYGLRCQDGVSETGKGSGYHSQALAISAFCSDCFCTI